MKRIFNKFLKEKPKMTRYFDEYQQGTLTTEFNHWVSSAKNAEDRRRFPFSAHTNKFQIRKWVEQIQARNLKKAS